jgi:hypothetical protein
LRVATEEDRARVRVAIDATGDPEAERLFDRALNERAR